MNVKGITSFERDNPINEIKVLNIATPDYFHNANPSFQDLETRVWTF